jgi:hypothetical protein
MEEKAGEKIMAETQNEISAEDEAKFQARFEAEQQLANPQAPGANEPANTSFIANSGIPEAYGAMQMAGEFAGEHPILTALAGGGALTALGKTPVGSVANKVAGAVVPGYGFAKDIATGAVNAAKDFAGHYGARNAAFDNRTFQSMLNKAATMEMKGEVGGQAYKNLVEEIDRMKALRNGAPIAPSSAGMNTAQQGINDMIRGGAQTAGATAEAAAPQGSRFAQLAQRFAPAMQKIAPMLEGAGKVAGKALAPAMIAKELFYTSPEEIEQLKQMEQNGTSLKDTMNKKYQQINTAIREAAAQKVLGQ